MHAASHACGAFGRLASPQDHPPPARRPRAGPMTQTTAVELKPVEPVAAVQIKVDGKEKAKASGPVKALPPISHRQPTQRLHDRRSVRIGLAHQCISATSLLTQEGEKIVDADEEEEMRVIAKQKELQGAEAKD